MEPRLHGLPASQHPGPAVPAKPVHLRYATRLVWLPTPRCGGPFTPIYPIFTRFTNKIGVIVYICVSEIADRRSKLPTLQWFSALMQGEKHAQGDSGPSGLADPGDYVGESSAHPYPLSSWRSEAEARTGLPSPSRMLLDGEWRFSFFGAPEQVPERWVNEICPTRRPSGYPATGSWMRPTQGCGLRPTCPSHQHQIPFPLRSAQGARRESHRLLLASSHCPPTGWPAAVDPSHLRRGGQRLPPCSATAAG